MCLFVNRKISQWFKNSVLLRDFRIAGVKDNEMGEYWMPEYPDYPAGYPDKAPSGQKKVPPRIKDEGDFRIINSEFEFCQELEFNPDEWCRYMLERLII